MERVGAREEFRTSGAGGGSGLVWVDKGVICVHAWA